jgi:hypothetical protein
VNESNGRLLAGDASEAEFARAITHVTSSPERLQALRASARETAQEFSVENCANRMLRVYEELLRDQAHGRMGDAGPWDRLRGRLEIEWSLLMEKTAALVAAAREVDATKAELE